MPAKLRCTILALFIAIGTIQAAPGLSALAIQTLWGNPSAARQLSEKGVKGIHAAERLLELRYEIDDAKLAELIKDLSADDPARQTAAANQIAIAPPSFLPQLEKYAQFADGNPKTRLDQAIFKVKRSVQGENQLIRLLISMYRKHTPLLFESYWYNIQSDPHHRPSFYYFAIAPFDVVWNRVKKEPAEKRLRFLLLRLHVGFDATAERELRSYSAQQILAAAKATYWPITIEPLQVDGDSAYATLASTTKGPVATRIFRINVKTIGNTITEQPGNWLDLKGWFSWTYIFEVRPIQNNRDAVVYAEGYPKAIGFLYWPSDRAIADLLINAGPTVIPTEVTPVRGLLPDVHIPIYAVTANEIAEWEKGRLYNWSRSVFPRHIRDKLTFLPNQYDIPKELPANW